MPADMTARYAPVLNQMRMGYFAKGGVVTPGNAPYSGGLDFVDQIAKTDKKQHESRIKQATNELKKAQESFPDLTVGLAPGTSSTKEMEQAKHDKWFSRGGMVGYYADGGEVDGDDDDGIAPATGPYKYDPNDSLEESYKKIVADDKRAAKGAEKIVNDAFASVFGEDGGLRKNPEAKEGHDYHKGENGRHHHDDKGLSEQIVDLKSSPPGQLKFDSQNPEIDPIAALALKPGAFDAIVNNWSLLRTMKVDGYEKGGFVGGFTPTLTAQNSGFGQTPMAPSGGGVNVGDINVNVNGGGTSTQTVNEIASGINRGIRRGTISFKGR
jgi:hypothetical protein